MTALSNSDQGASYAAAPTNVWVPTRCAVCGGVDAPCAKHPNAGRIAWTVKRMIAWGLIDREGVTPIMEYQQNAERAERLYPEVGEGDLLDAQRYYRIWKGT